MTDTNVEKWAQSRETSEEISEAIVALSQNLSHADRMWSDPSNEEIVAICERATKNGLLDDTVMDWGVSTLAQVMK